MLCWRAGSVAGRDLAGGVVRLGVRMFARESARVVKVLVSFVLVMKSGENCYDAPAPALEYLAFAGRTFSFTE